MDDQELHNLIDKEHLSIPPMMWGYFFPINIAVWRFLKKKRSNKISDVCAEKWEFISEIPGRLFIDGDKYIIERHPAGIPDLGENPEEPRLFGDDLDCYLQTVCRDGVVLDLIEELSWAYMKGIPKEIILSGIIQENDLPRIDDEKFEKLSHELLSLFDKIDDELKR